MANDLATQDMLLTTPVDTCGQNCPEDLFSNYTGIIDPLKVISAIDAQGLLRVLDKKRNLGIGAVIAEYNGNTALDYEIFSICEEYEIFPDHEVIYTHAQGYSRILFTELDEEFVPIAVIDKDAAGRESLREVTFEERMYAQILIGNIQINDDGKLEKAQSHAIHPNGNSNGNSHVNGHSPDVSAFSPVFPTNSRNQYVFSPLENQRIFGLIKRGVENRFITAVESGVREIMDALVADPQIAAALNILDLENTISTMIMTLSHDSKTKRVLSKDKELVKLERPEDKLIRKPEFQVISMEPRTDEHSPALLVSAPDGRIFKLSPEGIHTVDGLNTPDETWHQVYPNFYKVFIRNMGTALIDPSLRSSSFVKGYVEKNGDTTTVVFSPASRVKDILEVGADIEINHEVKQDGAEYSIGILHDTSLEDTAHDSGLRSIIDEVIASGETVLTEERWQELHLLGARSWSRGKILEAVPAIAAAIEENLDVILDDTARTALHSILSESSPQVQTVSDINSGYGFVDRVLVDQVSGNIDINLVLNDRFTKDVSKHRRFIVRIENGELQMYEIETGLGKTRQVTVTDPIDEYRIYNLLNDSDFCISEAEFIAMQSKLGDRNKERRRTKTERRREEIMDFLNQNSGVLASLPTFRGGETLYEEVVMKDEKGKSRFYKIIDGQWYKVQDLTETDPKKGARPTAFELFTVRKIAVGEEGIEVVATDSPLKAYLKYESTITTLENGLTIDGIENLRVTEDQMTFLRLMITNAIDERRDAEDRSKGGEDYDSIVKHNKKPGNPELFKTRANLGLNGSHPRNLIALADLREALTDRDAQYLAVGYHPENGTSYHKGDIQRIAPERCHVVTIDKNGQLKLVGIYEKNGHTTTKGTKTNGNGNGGYKRVEDASEFLLASSPLVANCPEITSLEGAIGIASKMIEGKTDGSTIGRGLIDFQQNILVKLNSPVFKDLPDEVKKEIALLMILNYYELPTDTEVKVENIFDGVAAKILKPYEDYVENVGDLSVRAKGPDHLYLSMP